MEFVYFILIGLAAGWPAGDLMKGGGFGGIGEIAVGAPGALPGGFLFRSLGVSQGAARLGFVIVATLGATVLIVILRFVRRAMAKYYFSMPTAWVR